MCTSLYKIYYLLGMYISVMHVLEVIGVLSTFCGLIIKIILITRNHMLSFLETFLNFHNQAH